MGSGKSAEMRRILEGLGKEKLMELLLEMGGLREGNMKWLETKLMGPKQLPESIEYYKKMILSGFYNNRGGPRLRLPVAKRAISDFRKAVKDREGLIDLMIFYVEKGTEFTMEYGDIHEEFYTSMDSMYLEVIKLLNGWRDKALIEKFRPRLQTLVKKTEDMGWGYHDNLSDMYDVLGKPKEEKKYYG